MKQLFFPPLLLSLSNHAHFSHRCHFTLSPGTSRTRWLTLIAPCQLHLCVHASRKHAVGKYVASGLTGVRRVICSELSQDGTKKKKKKITAKASEGKKYQRAAPDHSGSHAEHSNHPVAEGTRTSLLKPSLSRRTKAILPHNARVFPGPCERTWQAVSNTRLTLRLKTLQTSDPPGKVTKSHHNDGGLGSFTQQPHEKGSGERGKSDFHGSGRPDKRPRSSVASGQNHTTLAHRKSPKLPIVWGEMRIPLSLRREKAAEGAQRGRPAGRPGRKRAAKGSTFFGAHFGIFRPGNGVPKLGKRRVGDV